MYIVDVLVYLSLESSLMHLWIESKFLTYATDLWPAPQILIIMSLIWQLHTETICNRHVADANSGE